jgi:hypothetical protein
LETNHVVGNYKSQANVYANRLKKGYSEFIEKDGDILFLDFVKMIDTLEHNSTFELSLLLGAGRISVK